MLINRRASWTHSGGRHRSAHQRQDWPVSVPVCPQDCRWPARAEVCRRFTARLGRKVPIGLSRAGDQRIESTKHSPTFKGRTRLIRVFRNYVDDVLTPLVLTSQLAVANRALAMMPDDDRFDIFS